jgi:hypothetical protein
MSADLPLELRTLARLIETDAPVKFSAQDAAQLREAARELERLRAAVTAERAAILELIKSARADVDGDYVVRAVVDAIEARG